MRKRNLVLEYLEASFRGSGQVIFMDSPVSGLLNFVAIFWAAILGGTSYAVAIGALVGMLVSTAVAYVLRTDRDSLKMGLFGFNGMLVGAGLPTFLGNSTAMWVVLVFASVISTVVALAVGRFLKTWGIPGLTFPFVLTTWIFLLAAYRFPFLEKVSLPTATLVSDAARSTEPFGFYDFFHASLTSVSQVFFVDNPVSGAIFLLALLVHSRCTAVLAALGATLAVATSLWLGADPMTVKSGLWGYSAVLTAPAIGCIFLKPGAKAYAFAGVATLFTVFVQGATADFAATLGLPALTFPFVLATWLFLFAKSSVEVGEEKET